MSSGPIRRNRVREAHESFYETARRLHGDKFTYSFPDGPITTATRIDATCQTCGSQWRPVLGNHLNGSGCPGCYGNLPWNLKIFLEKAREVWGDAFDYSDVTEDHIKGCFSHVPVRCRKCDHEWEPTIQCHVNQKRKCPRCSGKLKWTFDRFIREATEIYGYRFAYKTIEVKKFNRKTTRIPISCRKCGHEWTTTVPQHIHRREVCPNC